MAVRDTTKSKKEDVVATEMSLAQVHLDSLISDAVYLQQMLEGLLTRRTGFDAKRAIARVLAEVTLITQLLPNVKEDTTDFSFQWAIDALVEGGVQTLPRALVPALERFIFAPALIKAAARKDGDTIQTDIDVAYIAVSDALQELGLSRTDADTFVIQRRAEVYDAAARIVPLPDRCWECLSEM